MSVDYAPQEVVRDETATYEQYRTLSGAAVASLVMGLLSSLALLDWIWVVLPPITIATAVYATRQIKLRPRELAGAGLARGGLTLALLFLVTGVGRLAYERATEVPEGYDRISYAELQPGIDADPNSVPASALELNGKKVFIKGFVYPGSKTNDIQTFLLVRDQGDCCFGGNPKITDRIQVTLKDPLRLTYRQRLFKLAGTFSVHPAQAIEAGGGVLYHLDADYLQ